LRNAERDLRVSVIGSTRLAKLASPYVFVSERGAPLSVAGYQRMVARAGEAAGFAFLVHSHMLRHSCGCTGGAPATWGPAPRPKHRRYKLANDGHDMRAIQHYLGHRSIASTVRYTALAPDRFKNFWKD
jgi:type 1 fimbriae regulatory protein FimB/type 1 fimbriae regulatory protein FimE